MDLDKKSAAAIKLQRLRQEYASLRQSRPGTQAAADRREDPPPARQLLGPAERRQRSCTHISHSAQTAPRNTGREADLSMQHIKAAAAAAQGSLKSPGDEQPTGRGYNHRLEVHA